jgi:RecJ-like exonuclease
MLSKSIDCLHCQGEGYVLEMGRAKYSSRFEVFEESESFVLCKSCKGKGILEVCSVCLKPFKIEQAIETCGCEVVELPKAA